MRGLMASVAAENNKTVQFELFISLDHLLDLIQSGLRIDDLNLLERFAGGSEDGAADIKDIGKIIAGHLAVFSVDHPFVPVFKADKLDVLSHGRKERFGHAAHSGI